MLTSRERVIRTLHFEQPDRVPRDLWLLPGVEMFRQHDIDRVLEKYPLDFEEPDFEYGTGNREQGEPNLKGEYTDEWGCVWQVGESGIIGEVKHPPLADLSNLQTYIPPYEVLENADLSRVNKSCYNSEKFILAWTRIRPFERMQFLRGSESLYLDLGYESAALRDLMEMVQDYFLRELDLWLDTDVDGIEFMDDWGAQNALLIDPEQWRALFKPLYREYCDRIHSAGKFVFFHSDGFITDIYPDLIEIGVDALNSQLFCMNMEELARQFSGEITFWGEIDRQHILPNGDRNEVRQAVEQVKRIFGDQAGGVIAQCEWGNDVTPRTVETVFESWLE